MQPERPRRARRQRRPGLAAHPPAAGDLPKERRGGVLPERGRRRERGASARDAVRRPELRPADPEPDGRDLHAGLQGHRHVPGEQPRLHGVRPGRKPGYGQGTEVLLLLQRLTAQPVSRSVRRHGGGQLPGSLSPGPHSGAPAGLSARDGQGPGVGRRALPGRPDGLDLEPGGGCPELLVQGAGDGPLTAHRAHGRGRRGRHLRLLLRPEHRLGGGLEEP